MFFVIPLRTPRSTRTVSPFPPRRASDLTRALCRREILLTPTKLLVGQILVVFAMVFAGVWIATQWCAAQFGYQPQLGSAWFVLFDTPVYRPWAVFPWWYHYEA